MKLSMSNIAWSPAERHDAYAAMVDADILGLEIAPGLFFDTAEDPFDPDEAVARAALDEVRAVGLTLVSMQSLLFGVKGAALFDGLEACRRFEAGMVRAIELAGRLGVPNLVFGSPRQRNVPREMTEAAALDHAAVIFRRLGDQAVFEGTKIAIEANPVAYGTNFLNTIDQAAEFVDLVDHPGIALILDLGAMHMNGGFDATPNRIPALLPRLNHVHISAPNLSMAPSDAAALVPILNALRTGNYAKAVSIEMKRAPEGLVAVKAALENLAAANDLGQIP